MSPNEINNQLLKELIALLINGQMAESKPDPVVKGLDKKLSEIGPDDALAIVKFHNSLVGRLDEMTKRIEELEKSCN